VTSPREWFLQEMFTRALSTMTPEQVEAIREIAMKKETRMSTIKPRKATKKQVKLRGAFYSLSGGGKTRGSLRVATGMALAMNKGAIPTEGPGRIGVIDSEDGDSELYADQYDFDVIVLGRDTVGKSPDDYIDALEAGAKAGWGVVVIDSLSHAWRELLEQVDEARAASNGNRFTPWAQATPKHKELVEAIKRFPGHVIATMRADTAWSLENEDGKNKPKRIGLKPEQGKGIEYEFSFLVSLDQNHLATVEKDRTGKFQDRRMKLLDEGFGKELLEWLEDGRKPFSDWQKGEVKRLLLEAGVRTALNATLLALNENKPIDTYEDGERVIAGLQRMVDEKKAQITEDLKEVTKDTPAPQADADPSKEAPSTTAEAPPSTSQRGTETADAPKDPPASSPSPSSSPGGRAAPKRASITSEALAFAAAIDTCKKVVDVNETLESWKERLEKISREEARAWCRAYAKRRSLIIEGAAIPEDVMAEAKKIDKLRTPTAA
jgi:hypothetical protein